MEVSVLIGLVLLNGIFAMAEIALVTARKTRLTNLANKGNKAASVAIKLGEDSTRFLSTVQIGITSIGILNGIIGEALLAVPLSQILQGFGLSLTLANTSATTIVVIIITYISIVLGELLPKRLGQIKPEPIACWVARPMQILATITHPFVVLLSFSTHVLLKLIGIRQHAPANITEDEIHDILDEGLQTGAIETHEHQMARNALRLDDRPLSSLMTPCRDVVFLDIQLSSEQNLQRLIEAEHSRFPVCNGGFNQVLGVIHAKQVLTKLAKGEASDYSKNLDKSLFVLETMTGVELLEQFRINHTQIAFVTNQHGEVKGIVTVQDILGAIVNESTYSTVESQATQREDGSWLFDGSISISELQYHLNLNSIPEENTQHYYTLNGMLMLLIGSVPITSQYVDWGGWRFEIVDMDNHRIDKVLATSLKL